MHSTVLLRLTLNQHPFCDVVRARLPECCFFERLSVSDMLVVRLRHQKSSVCVSVSVGVFTTRHHHMMFFVVTRLQVPPRSELCATNKVDRAARHCGQGI